MKCHEGARQLRTGQRPPNVGRPVGSSEEPVGRRSLCAARPPRAFQNQLRFSREGATGSRRPRPSVCRRLARPAPPTGCRQPLPPPCGPSLWRCFCWWRAVSPSACPPTASTRAAGAAGAAGLGAAAGAGAAGRAHIEPPHPPCGSIPPIDFCPLLLALGGVSSDFGWRVGEKFFRGDFLGIMLKCSIKRLFETSKNSTNVPCINIIGCGLWGERSIYNSHP